MLFDEEANLRLQVSSSQLTAGACWLAGEASPDWMCHCTSGWHVGVYAVWAWDLLQQHTVTPAWLCLPACLAAVPPLQVPGSINQHLRSYQREGVQFLFSRYAAGAAWLQSMHMHVCTTQGGFSVVARCQRT